MLFYPSNTPDFTSGGLKGGVNTLLIFNTFINIFFEFHLLILLDFF